MSHLLCVQIHTRFQDKGCDLRRDIQSLTACASEKNTEMVEKGSQFPFPYTISGHCKP